MLDNKKHKPMPTFFSYFSDFVASSRVSLTKRSPTSSKASLPATLAPVTASEPYL